MADPARNPPERPKTQPPLRPAGLEGADRQAASSTARFVVGIDLGTSNSAVAYADLHRVRAAGRPLIEALEVLQLVAPGDVQPRRLLPSAVYTPAGFEIRAEDTLLPWAKSAASEAGGLSGGAPNVTEATEGEISSEPAAADQGSPLFPREVVGEGARRLGAKTPIRLIESSKSWLCHGGVNRASSILPWHAPEGVPKRSPVEVATAILTHIRDAWDHQVARGDASLRLAHQHVIITVPASFDEVARRLTLEASSRAALPDVHLIEEPLAAFYAYIARTGGTAATTGLGAGDQVLIADVGGGTTDFTLVRVSEAEVEGGPLGFERTAVGEHLLLGGDNMDLALAHAVEPSLTRGKKLDAEGWAQLKLECRLAKETLFSHPEQDSLPITITGRGKKLLGGTMRAELHRETLDRVVVEGYFPELPPGSEARPEVRRTVGFSEYGLPYATDPRITRHLAAFLLRHAGEDEAHAKVDAILFNGGALKPILIRDRISEVLGSWTRRTSQSTDLPNPRALVWDEGEAALELAVARGAAYFGLVREGLGLRVGGGSPREYFLGLGEDPGEVLPPNVRKVVCIAPRGMQDGQSLEVSDNEFQLVTNRPVAFPLFATASPRKDPVGSIQFLDADELHELPPLQTVIKFGKQKAGTKVPVRIQVRRTELGTLELSCLSKMSGARFKLEFDLRAMGERPPDENGEAPRSADEEVQAAAAEVLGGAGTRPPPEEGDVDPERLEAAKRRIDETFVASGPERLPPAKLMKGLEEDLGLERDAFPLFALRGLAEHLIERMEHRGGTPELEARWLNVTGFCLRPGFGLSLDDWRVRQLWKIHGPGPIHPGSDEVVLNWWILWRRVAGGLSRGPQDELSSRLFPLLIPSLHKRAKKKPPKPQSQEAAEMWRAAAALEQISAKQRATLGGALMELLEAKKSPKGGLWCLSRIGARKLLYGPRESTVKPSVAVEWLERLYALPKTPKDEDPTAAILALARVTGDRQLDLPEEARQKAAQVLEARGVSEAIRRALVEVVEVDRGAQSAAFGDTLPTGLTLS